MFALTRVFSDSQVFEDVCELHRKFDRLISERVFSQWGTAAFSDGRDYQEAVTTDHGSTAKRFIDMPPNSKLNRDR